jgi:hypothetical protein
MLNAGIHVQDTGVWYFVDTTPLRKPGGGIKPARLYPDFRETATPMRERRAPWSPPTYRPSAPK